MTPCAASVKPPRICVECVMTWLLKGDGAVCLACNHAVYWKEGFS